jgi:hypothetical protein
MESALLEKLSLDGD